MDGMMYRVHILWTSETLPPLLIPEVKGPIMISDDSVKQCPRCPWHGQGIQNASPGACISLRRSPAVEPEVENEWSGRVAAGPAAQLLRLNETGCKTDLVRRNELWEGEA